jgi:methionyl-tRNA formyltransferase
MSRVSGPGEGAPGEVLEGGLRVACGDGVVRLLTVQRPSKSAQPADEMLRGFAIPVGTLLA